MGTLVKQQTSPNELDLAPFRLTRRNLEPFIARIPGSKSYTNRALILGAQRVGRTEIAGALHCEDTEFLAECLGQFGGLSVKKTREGFSIRRDQTRLTAPAKTLYVGGGGTPARLLLAFAVMVDGETTIDGNARLRERPMGDLLDAFTKVGVRYQCLAQEGCLPVRIAGGPVRERAWYVKGSTSSQFLTALLLMAAQQPQPTTIHVEGDLVSKSYVEMTLKMMEDGGFRVEHTALREFLVHPGQPRHDRINIEVDASAMSYFLGAAALTGTTVVIPGITKGSRQGDAGFARLMAEMGAQVSWRGDALVVSGGEIRGIQTEMDNMPDTVLTLAVVASQGHGDTKVSNIANLKVKECDRIHAIEAELTRLGVSAQGGEDTVIVHPGNSVKPGLVHTYKDHRVAMAFSLLGLVHDGIRIQDPKCVEKSFPGYWQELARFVAHHNGEGARAAGGCGCS
jgi:3-phosphoshikimate 1-carboxyvinyltransferase